MHRPLVPALFITLGVFGGLTLCVRKELLRPSPLKPLTTAPRCGWLIRFAFQTKYDFDGLAPYLFGGLMVLVTTSFVGVFFPFSQGMDLFLALGSCLIFSGAPPPLVFFLTGKLTISSLLLQATSCSTLSRS